MEFVSLVLMALAIKLVSLFSRICRIFVKGSSVILFDITTYLVLAIRCIRLANMERPIIVHIFTFSFIFRRQCWLNSTLPFMRVGRMIIKVSNDRLKLQRMHHRTLVATCVAMLTFPSFLKINLSGKRHLFPKVSDWLIRHLLYLICSRLSIMELEHLIALFVKMENRKLLIYSFPNILLIDTSLNSKDIRDCLFLKFCSLYDVLCRYTQSASLLDIPLMSEEMIMSDSFDYSDCDSNDFARKADLEERSMI